MNIKLADPEDADLILKWSESNAIDPEVLSYPLTKILRADNGDGPLAFMPAQTVLMLESLALDPCASKLSLSRAILQLLASYIVVAEKSKIRELYFIGTDRETNLYAERLGFERLVNPVYRLKLNGVK